MRKAVLAFALIVGLLFVPVTAANAAFDPTGAACSASGASDSPVCNQGSDNPLSGSNGLILKAFQIFLIFAAVIAVIMIMLGGWAYITSQGEPQKLKGAKDTILYAIIGLVIAASAQAIISFVIKKV